jgi:hypothetical protein
MDCAVGDFLRGQLLIAVIDGALLAATVQPQVKRWAAEH